MKKTHNINIGNSIIHIEEDAYEMLTIYLNEVKQHFARNADDFEIVTDIENRIAEMFAEMLSVQQKQVIGIADVQSVMQQMGSVKDFETSEETDEKYAAPQEYDSIKKLYRDTDQAMIAGVCAGLAHYLDLNVKWVRLFTFLTIFIFGSGLLAYIIFWIMVPKAKTRFERMSMYGEEPTLRGFANSHQHPLVKQSKGFVAEFFEVIWNFLQGTGRIILKVIAISITVFGSFLILALISAAAALFGFWDADIFSYFPLNIINQEYIPAVVFAALLLFGIPVLALIIFSLRVAFNGKPINKAFSFGMLIVWLGSVVFGIYYVAKISSEFKEGAEFTQNTAIRPFKEYTLKADFTKFFTKEDSLNYGIDPQNYKERRILDDRDDDFDAPRNIWIRIEKSEDGKTEISQNYKARGKTFEAALKNAQNVHYGFLQQGAVLNFGPMLWLPKNANWRGQEVALTMKVPVGTQIRVSRSLHRYLSIYDYWTCNDNAGDAEFTDWVMTESGLKCKHLPIEEPKKEEE
ncbi:PspC domain-containing protein [Pedobacter africanus]|uniref:Phage shock protein C (PspC) family protein n=1 Tax=Pedobacter africanus TaxID=151894 RepID=A0A1W2ANA7_9SPHI|nr:PspC domain-containing protein [Pedobacter africanus]SMC62176.1 phage shock protein C (PspC) family protein [Pedobacter africanus]